VNYTHWLRYSALVRPFDPAVAGYRVVLIATAVALLGGFIWSLVLGQGWQSVLLNSVIFAMAVFGSWLLGRELLPDDSAAAYVSMVLAFLACLVYAPPGVLALYTTLGLVRMVNRSSGQEARKLDSVLLILLVIWTVYACQNPWFAAVAGLAFLLDASLNNPLRRQLLFAVLGFGTMVVYIVDHDVAWLDIHAPHTLLQWLAIAAILLFALNLALLKKVHSRAGPGRKRLNPERIKAGIVVALLACLQGLDSMPQFVLLVTTIGGLCLGIAFRRSFRTTTKGLRH
jgi:hypothetical protein